MANDRDLRPLRDELHDLADDVTPGSAVAGRDRARRGIARHERNRRAAIGGAAAVIVVAGTVFIAVDRDAKSSQRPIPPADITTTPSITPTTAFPTPSTTNPAVPIESRIPSQADLPDAPAASSHGFAWGTGDNQVAFHTPQGEGVSGGPVAFTADAAGDIVMLDHSSSRIVRFEHGSPAASHIALAGPAVTAAAIDLNGFVIVATVGDVAVFGPDGRAAGSWPGLSPTPITALSIVADTVFSVTDHNTRTPILRETEGRYIRLQGAVPEPTPITVDIHPTDSRVFTLTVSATGRQYRITASDALVALRSARLLPNGTLAFVLQLVSSDGGQSPDSPSPYVVGLIDPAGTTQYTKVAASMGYLVNGPGFVINDDGLAVMSSTTAGGVNVSYYPFS